MKIMGTECGYSCLLYYRYRQHRHHDLDLVVCPLSSLNKSLDPTFRPSIPVLPTTGEAAVGKSSLVLRFVQNDFNENTSPTIGAAFLTQSA